jgi:hypothetical protein
VPWAAVAASMEEAVVDSTAAEVDRMAVVAAKAFLL